MFLFHIQMFSFLHSCSRENCASDTRKTYEKTLKQRAALDGIGTQMSCHREMSDAREAAAGASVVFWNVK